MVVLLAWPALAQRLEPRLGFDDVIDVSAAVDAARREAAGMPAAPGAGRPKGLRAGTAKVDITPGLGTPLQGYGYRFRLPSRGVRDPLHARVLVLETGQGLAVLVGCDLTAVMGDFHETILRKARKSLPSLGPGQLTVFATHTHSAAAGLYDNFFAQLTGGRFRSDYFERTTDEVAAAVVSAAQDLQPAKLFFARGEVAGLNENRASWEGGPVDSELGLLRVEGLDGKTLAWLVDFSAHPTTLGANLKFSADYPAALYRELEADGSVALFANGAGADQGIARREEDASREALAERAGTTLARKAQELSKSAAEEQAPSLTTERRLVPLPDPHARLFGRSRTALSTGLNAWVTKRFKTLFPEQAPLGLIRLGGVLLLTVPGELSAETGLALKAKAAQLGYDLLIIGLANDYIGYVVPESRYREKSYESKSSFYGPGLAEELEKSLLEMLPPARRR